MSLREYMSLRASCIKCLQNIYQLFPTLQLTGFTFCADLYYHIKPNQNEVVFYHAL